MWKPTPLELEKEEQKGQLSWFGDGVHDGRAQ